MYLHKYGLYIQQKHTNNINTFDNRKDAPSQSRDYKIIRRDPLSDDWWKSAVLFHGIRSALALISFPKKFSPGAVDRFNWK
jgi:hypothetical protein